VSFKYRSALLVLLIPAVLSSCTRCAYAPEYRVDFIRAPLPPISAFEMTRRPYQPYSLKFRLAVLNFVDQTGAAGQLVKTIPDVLTTTLYDASRFDLYDRGQLRDKTTKDVEALIPTLPVDGLLQGAITQIRTDQKVIVCDIRVTNKYSSAVMFASSAEISYTGAIDVVLARENIASLSRAISDSFPRLDERQPAKILEINGNTVTISAGVDRGIKTGVAALVEASGGGLTRDIDTGEVLASNYYVGQVSVISVVDRVAKAQIDASGEIRVGDLVIFK
jgi:hypothetical protein